MREFALSDEEPSDTALWLVAVGLSLLANLAFLALLATADLRETRESRPVPAAPDQFLTIQPILRAAAEPSAEEPAPKPKSFVRTSAEQGGPRPEAARFFGEHDTQAASEREAVPGAPEELPSQEGIKGLPDEVETTQSDYQDGALEHQVSGKETPQDTAEAMSGPGSDSSRQAQLETALAEQKKGIEPRPETRLAESPLPVDRPVREEQPKEGEERREEAQDREARQESLKETPAAEHVQPAAPPAPSPGFRGHQRRTELKGSISRRGKSALDVESGVLGRYHAALSRAIEKAWQKEATKNRDYITPGVIRVRVVLDPQGKVRSVSTVEEFGIGTIQRGFTHMAIREAELPPMPEEVRRELQGEPLELLYNFIF